MGNGKEGEAWEGREKLPLWVKGFQVIMIALCVCVYNFLVGESFPCLDSPEGCQEGAGMWVRTTLELDNGA